MRRERSFKRRMKAKETIAIERIISMGLMILH